MKEIIGPFLKNNKDGMWHWMKACPDYPTLVNPETKISAKCPDENSLCSKCLKIQNKKKSLSFKEDFDI